MLDAGIGVRQINTILTALNLPAVNHSLIKWCERFVGPLVESVAQTSCNEALKLEKKLTVSNER